MQFTDTGTLIRWQLDDIDVVAPLHDKPGGGSRGGVYLCIPNFEELSPPFSIKHGEYRTTVCDVTLPHQKNLAASNENDWGNIEVVTDWEETDEQHSKTLKVTTNIRALSETALIRPGFHPYFSITPNSFLDITGTRIDVATLPHDSMRAYPANSVLDEVRLNTSRYSMELSCQINSPTPDVALAFGIWSDKKAEYVCIEPIIGHQPGPDGLPTPLKLIQDDKLVLGFTIRAERLEILD